MLCQNDFYMELNNYYDKNHYFCIRKMIFL